ncbi:MAG: hypothetical protein WC710_13215 [Gallionella sp.]|jgi:hypothetical protein
MPRWLILHELMRDFVQRQRDARKYEDFLSGKIDQAREQIRNGQFISNEEVEATFAGRRAAAQVNNA